jgi:hypothetical protein
MALKHNGKLIIRFGEAGHVLPAIATRLAAPAPLFEGFVLQPLFTATESLAGPHAAAFAATPSAPLADRWAIATPTQERPLANPWDHAHEVAAQAGYQHYVEPNILHEARGPTTAPSAPPAVAAPPSGPALDTTDATFKPHWPPKVVGSAGPAWHLESNFTGFADAHTAGATGQGVRIAHLDTGYAGPTGPHPSQPRRLLTNLARDFTVDPPAHSAIDPGSANPLLQSGHGTATLALLAGTSLDLRLQTRTGTTLTFSGDFGGAPESEVVPVRIGESVIHLYTSDMALGLDYALASGCDVVTLSHGGLPSRAWAAAVNRLYDGGIILAAASGDSVNFKVITLATHFTVYPSAFNRAITVCGATFDKAPYITSNFAELQGCWGPESVMDKAVSAYTPNVAWMEMTTGGYTMDGGGTSASTPQVAAACALWLQRHGGQYPVKDWRRVEACRLALFSSAAQNAKDKNHLGWGLLDVPAMLQQDRADRILAAVQAGHVKMRPEDSVAFPLFRLIVGLGPPDSEQNRMYETEVAQVALSTTNAQLLDFAQRAIQGGLSASEIEVARHMLLAEDLSQPLRQALVEAA